MFLREDDLRVIFEVDDIVKVTNDAPLSGNFIAPPVVIGEEYPVKNIFLDKMGNQHLDLGLKSQHNWITSWETNEILPNEDVHWVHPSRVVFIQ